MKARAVKKLKIMPEPCGLIDLLMSIAWACSKKAFEVEVVEMKMEDRDHLENKLLISHRKPHGGYYDSYLVRCSHPKSRLIAIKTIRSWMNDIFPEDIAKAAADGSLDV